MYPRPKILFLLIFFTASALALPDDGMQKFTVRADSSTLNYKSGFNLYEGHVQINQGTSRLIADKVTTQNNANHKIKEATAFGKENQAEYWTTPNAKEQQLHAIAKIIHFMPFKSLIVLEENVTITQGKNIFHGQKIIYNIKDQTVTVPSSNQGQSTIIIDPAQLQ